MHFMKFLRPAIMEGLRVSLIMATGDVIAQTFVDKKPIQELDYVRTLKFGSIGLVLVGPALRVWYNVLDTAVKKEQTALKRGLQKVALDQLIFAPFFCFVVTYAVSFMNGLTTEQINDRLRKEYFDIMKMNYRVWPAVQIINFTLVPLQYQVVFAQFIAIFWNCYLSMVLNKQVEK